MIFLLFFVFFIIFVWTVVKILIDYWYITVPTIALIIIYAKIKSNRAKAKKDSKSAWHEREEWTDYINADDESAWHDPLKDRQQSADDESNWYQYTQEEKDKDQRRWDEWEREFEEECEREEQEWNETWEEFRRFAEEFNNKFGIGKYYKVLELDTNATLEQIKARYRELALKWHPDRNKTGKEQATKKFTKINEAYEKIIENMKVEECTS